MKKPTRPLAAVLSIVLAVTGCSTGPAPVASAPPAPTATPTPVTTGEAGGVIADEHGHPLPGVLVEISGSGLETRTAATDLAGRFRFVGLPPGRYEIRGRFAGYYTASRVIEIVVARASRLDIAMSPGGPAIPEALTPSAAAQVTVTGDAPVIDVTRSTVGMSTAAPDRKAEKKAGAKGKAPKPTAAPLTAAPNLVQALAFSGDSSYSGARAVPSSGLTLRPSLTPSLRNLHIVNAKPFPDMFFRNFGVNPTIDTEEEPLSTFAVDVDTASYALARSYLGRGALPEPDGVRVEEFVNSFRYRYAPPADDEPFAVHAEAFPSPNRKGYHVLHVGLQARTIDPADRKPANLVFTVDVSGSMATENRLGLVKKALRLLVDQLRPSDTVGIVVYGSNARVLLEPVSVEERGTILSTIDALKAEGSTNAQDGIEEGYRMAARHLRAGGINRIVLCSDGVANNGITDADGIFERVRKQASKGITVSAVGFGMGNYNDVLMERLAQVGHGNYAYVDRLEEARRIFVRELTGTLQVVAKDVKIQVELDKRAVARYRLLGYENRALTAEEFHDDTVDGGNVGAGHAVTALYEVKLKPGADRLGIVRIRYKTPEGSRSALLAKPLPRSIVRPTVESASSPSRLSLVAAAFAEKLRGSYWVRNLSYDELLALHDALAPRLKEREDVAELRTLIQTARSLDRRADRFEKASPVAEMDYDSVPVLQ